MRRRPFADVWRIEAEYKRVTALVARSEVRTIVKTPRGGRLVHEDKHVSRTPRGAEAR